MCCTVEISEKCSFFCEFLLDPSQQETILCNTNFLQNLTNPSLQGFYLSVVSTVQYTQSNCNGTKSDL